MSNLIPIPYRTIVRGDSLITWRGGYRNVGGGGHDFFRVPMGGGHSIL